MRTQRVRFCFKVAFWFPASHQLTFPVASSRGPQFIMEGPTLPSPGVLTAVRRKPNAKPSARTRLYAPGYEAPSPENAGYRLGGITSRSAPSVHIASSASEAANPHSAPISAFDSVVEHRVLQGQSDWPEWRFVALQAIKTSVFPGNPLGRFMHHNVAGLPTPQVMGTPARRFEARGSVVFDLIGASHLALRWSTPALGNQLLPYCRGYARFLLFLLSGMVKCASGVRQCFQGTCKLKQIEGNCPHLNLHSLQVHLSQTLSH